MAQRPHRLWGGFHVISGAQTPHPLGFGGRQPQPSRLLVVAGQVPPQERPEHFWSAHSHPPLCRQCCVRFVTVSPPYVPKLACLTLPPPQTPHTTEPALGTRNGQPAKKGKVRPRRLTPLAGRSSAGGR